METNSNENDNDVSKEQIVKDSNKFQRFSFQSFFNIIVSILLLVMLYLLFFNNKQEYTPKQAGSMTIAFINSDSLMSQYLLFQDLKDEIEKETIHLSNDIQQREQALRNQFMSYQKKVESGNISYDDARKTEENLGRQQQSLIELSEKYTSQIADKEYFMSKQILDSITEMIVVMKKEYDFDYVLGYTQGAGILYADPKYDITAIVVQKLNDNYKKIKK
jgi:outer membrane protein